MADVSDVAVLKRLRGSGPWLRWMRQAMIGRLSVTARPVAAGRAVKRVDAGVVGEPGATGSTWRLHSALDLSPLQCEQARATALTWAKARGTSRSRRATSRWGMVVRRTGRASATCPIMAAMWCCA
ncbi:hypothetical protein XthCFBP4691_20665 [Xanthomonas theicola]|uniref:Uncharacterized protein n=1 Tax=Xanthomonas theicola TaxID=56464 RepID=A0A2S6YZ71_9XANT|nr:hypothetical protein XthCFBP4691_20665 [Xanthomonas theicola]